MFQQHLRAAVNIHFGQERFLEANADFQHETDHVGKHPQRNVGCQELIHLLLGLGQ